MKSASTNNNQRSGEDNIPRHIAIIMDGNGRWAKEKNLPRFAGHKEGVNTVREITRECGKIGVDFLTLFTFSSENWLRPPTEVNALMKLLTNTMRREIKNLHENNVRFNAIGDTDKLPDQVKTGLQESIEFTKNNTGLTLVLALNYGGRQEIVNAVQKAAQAVADKKIQPKDLTISGFQAFLGSSELPDPDLLIRTGGDLRISNFMLWQIAYTELYVTRTFWPAFDLECLHHAIESYKQRERRYGKISEQIQEVEHH